MIIGQGASAEEESTLGSFLERFVRRAFLPQYESRCFMRLTTAISSPGGYPPPTQFSPTSITIRLCLERCTSTEPMCAVLPADLSCLLGVAVICLLGVPVINGMPVRLGCL